MAGMNKIQFNSPISLQSQFDLTTSGGDQEVHIGDGRMDFCNYTGPVTLEYCGSYNKIISVGDSAIYLAYTDYDHDNDYPLESYINLKKDHGGSSNVIIELGAIAGGGAIMAINSDGYISADAVFKAQQGIVTNSIVGSTGFATDASIELGTYIGLYTSGGLSLNGQSVTLENNSGEAYIEMEPNKGLKMYSMTQTHLYGGSDALNELTMSNSGVKLLYNNAGIEINNDYTRVRGDYVSISQNYGGITLDSYGLKIEHNGEESAINFENNNGLDIYSYNKAKFHVDKDDKEHGLFLNGDSTDKLVLNGVSLTDVQLQKLLDLISTEPEYE